MPFETFIPNSTLTSIQRKTITCDIIFYRFSDIKFQVGQRYKIINETAVIHADA